MPFYVNSNTKEYEVAESNIYRAVLADIIDLGYQPQLITKDGVTSTGYVPKMRIVWILDAKDSEGRYLRASKPYTVSVHEKANFHKLVVKLTGKVPQPGYDAEELLGASRMLMIEKKTYEGGPRKGKPYAAIEGISALPAGTPPFAIPSDFVRNINSPKPIQPAPMPSGQAPVVSAPAQTQAVSAAPAAVATVTSTELDDLL